MKKDAILTIIFRGISASLNLLIGVLTARMLGSEGRGIFAIVFNILTLILLFGNMGLSVSNIYFISNDSHNENKVISVSFYFSLFVGVIFAVLGFVLLKTELPSMVGYDIYSKYIFIILVIVPFALVNKNLITVFQAKQEFIKFNLYSITQNFMFVLLFAIGYFFYSQFKLLQLSFYILDISYFTAFILVVYLLFGKIKISQFDFNFLKKSLSFGLKGYIANINGFLNYRADLFILAIYKEPAEVGIYSISVVVAESLLLISESLSIVLAPKVGRSKGIEGRELTNKVLYYNFLILTFLSFIIAVTGYWLIPVVFGNEYLTSFYSSLILLPGIIVIGLASNLASYFIGVGNTSIFMTASTLSLISNIVMDFLFIPKYGMYGAATASTISYFVSFLYGYMVYLKYKE